MGLEMESDSDKNSTGLSPNTVLPSPRQCLNLEKRNARGKPTRRDDILRVKEGFTEISFRRYRSASCKSTQSRPFGPEDSIELKRDGIEKLSAETGQRDTFKDGNFRCDEVAGPKVITRSRASSKTRFSPIRKIFDPFMKSKSLRSPLGYMVQPDEVVKTGMEKMRREGTLRKSLLHDFSHTVQNSEFDSQFVKKDQHHSVVANSPVHLHGLLKLENKQGVPFLEFSLNCPEDVIVARAWKEDNAFNWVYTFHSIDGRKKSNASGWGSSDINKECSMVGQMQRMQNKVSSLKNARSVPLKRHLLRVLIPGLIEGSHELVNDSDLGRFKDQPKYASNKSNPCPWASGDLSPSLEIAAVVIQVPFEKRESLKCKRGHKTSDKMHSNLLNFSAFDGNHGLPGAKSRGPSPLLDRWRLGGGCDCGGWDMACPLTVFSNPKIQYAEDKLLLDNQQPLELFVQGAKENTPALSMIVLEEGWYAVDFHAQLSTLQAFSICVAILHGTETPFPAGQEKSMPLPHCNSLKMLIEEEVKFLIDAVTEDEKKKVTKRMEEMPPSYVINPPFSPMSRV
ncbi:hypothetical protein Patl1_17727 [Pistacia atlantica]|uniref:Uncharacterized protein n=1 Tax=Pistacia atlantica TaxID=434234 RepID=A0ACC1C0H1_9ROSI|nr:hypothetical protein Patl1_17727 [Pistacia atlantica]